MAPGYLKLDHFNRLSSGSVGVRPGDSLVVHKQILQNFHQAKSIESFFFVKKQEKANRFRNRCKVSE